MTEIKARCGSVHERMRGAVSPANDDTVDVTDFTMYFLMTAPRARCLSSHSIIMTERV